MKKPNEGYRFDPPDLLEEGLVALSGEKVLKHVGVCETRAYASVAPIYPTKRGRGYQGKEEIANVTRPITACTASLLAPRVDRTSGDRCRHGTGRIPCPFACITGNSGDSQ